MSNYLVTFIVSSPSNHDHDLALELTYPDVGVVEHTGLPKLNWRSRGRHNPGDGRYVNRWVSAKSVDATTGESLVVDDQWETFNEKLDYLPTVHVTHWDSERCYIGNVSCRLDAGGYQKWWVMNLDKEFDFTGRAIWNGMWHAYIDGAISFSYFYPIGPASEVSKSEAVAKLLDTLENRKARSLPGATRAETISHMRYRGMPAIIPPEVKFSDEMADFDDRVDLLPHYGLDGAINTAFVRAVDGLPNLDRMNNIANGFELLGLLKSTLLMLLSPSIDDIGKLGDAWLGYRYAYCTTKADVAEAISYQERILDLVRGDHIRSHGYYSQGEWYVRSSLEVTTSAFAGLRTTLEKYSVALSSYRAWDLIPYSFVVDWFLDVGSLLEDYDSRNIAMRIKNKGTWISIERRWKNEYGFDEVYYYRYFTQPDLAHLARESHGARAVTWLKRGLDVIALFS